MLCLSGFELYSRWVPLVKVRQGIKRWLTLTMLRATGPWSLSVASKRAKQDLMRSPSERRRRKGLRSKQNKTARHTKKFVNIFSPYLQPVKNK